MSQSDREHRTDEPEDRAGAAGHQLVAGVGECTQQTAAEPRSEVEDQVAPPAEMPFEARAEAPQREAVEAEVQEVDVHEDRAEQPPELTVLQQDALLGTPLEEGDFADQWLRKVVELALLQLREKTCYLLTKATLPSKKKPPLMA